MTMKLKKTGIALLSAMLVLGNVTPVMATQTRRCLYSRESPFRTGGADTAGRKRRCGKRDRGLRQYYKAEDRCGNRKKDR